MIMAIHINMNNNIHNRKLWKAIIFTEKKLNLLHFLEMSNEVNDFLA